jgi:hypothetical protein
MSATDAQEFADFMVEREKERNTQRPERAVAVRRLDTQIEAGDGRTSRVRIVPFGERDPAPTVSAASQRRPVPGGAGLPGLFDKQLRAANRVLLNFEHQQGIGGVVGHGLDLAHRSDGYHGTFRIHETPTATRRSCSSAKASSGRVGRVVLAEVDPVRAAGVIQRVKAHLEAVAICRRRVPVRRDDSPSAMDEIPTRSFSTRSFCPSTQTPRCSNAAERLGIRIPQRYQAHPAETDTPAETGTSEDGTRHTQANADSSEE